VLHVRAGTNQLFRPCSDGQNIRRKRDGMGLLWVVVMQDNGQPLTVSVSVGWDNRANHPPQ
jgi:hypothetical protein